MEPVRPRWRRWLGRGLRLLAGATAIWLAVVLVLILLYSKLDPPFTTLTAAAYLTGEEVDQSWVPLTRISPHLVRAVIVSEDAGFCQHFGISVRELEQAIERARDGVPRGASTLSMQVIKNLFLWPQRSYIRKAIELPLTVVMELVLSKRRIVEIYLNIAEWGPGVYGVEAAARHHFNKPAARLTEAEAALLAVSLPSPLTREPDRPGPGLQRLAKLIEARARANSKATACLGL